MNLKFTLNDEIHQVEASSDKTILDNLKDFDIPWSCLEGHCSSCMCKLISGEIVQVYFDPYTNLNYDKVAKGKFGDTEWFFNFQ